MAILTPLKNNNDLLIYQDQLMAWETPIFAPEAQNVSINGTTVVGRILTGSYTYYDVEGNPEGVSTFKWYRANSYTGSGQAVISGEVSTYYTLAIIDVSKFIAFEVTPISTIDPSIGISVKIYADSSTASGYIDDFQSYTDNVALGGQGKWVTSLNTFNVSTGSSDKGFVANTNTAVCIAIYDQSLNKNQFAEVIIDSINPTPTTNDAIGVAVHMSGSAATCNGYGYYHLNGTQRLWRVDNGTKTNIESAGTAAAIVGDVIRLEIIDTSLFCYRNGVLDTAVGINGTGGATEYTSGRAGVSGYTTSAPNGLSRGDMFRCGNL